MDLQQHTQPRQLERYSFLWSQARLVIAAIALFIGGTPPIYKLIPIPALFGLIGTFLTLCWIIAGLAAGYLLFRWFEGNQMLFGQKIPMDKVAFFVLVVSGINLGLAGILKKNIGMSLVNSYPIFIIVGLAYLVSAWYLRKRWLDNGGRIF